MARHPRRPKAPSGPSTPQPEPTPQPPAESAAKRPVRTRRVATLDLRAKSQASDEQLAIRAVVAMGKRARTDLATFFDLVMREEFSKEPLRTAPHQRVMFSFVNAHRRCVFRQPIGTSKTYSMTALGLHLLGQDVTSRNMIASATQDMAKKPLSMISDYITQPDLNVRLGLVFPELRRSVRPSDPWTSDRLTVARPAGIRDPSLVAVGLDTKFQGARLSFVLADDVVNEENSRTKEAREELKGRFMNRYVSRLDRHVGSNSLCVVTNTPWDREDLTYYLEKEAGWATCVMDIYGDLRFTNAKAEWLYRAQDEGLIRPSRLKKDVWRLTAHDPDSDEMVPLWPGRFSSEMIAEARREFPPHEFARMFLCEPFEAGAQRCQLDWVEKCKMLGIGLTLEHNYRGSYPTFMGIDLGIGQGGKNDMTVFFVFEVQPDGRRRILWIESGRWTGPVIVAKLIDIYDRYRVVAAVETVQAQEYLRQFAIEERKDLILQPHATNRVNKHAVDFGVESIFTEVQHGAWIIPCDVHGVCEPEVQKWIDNMLFYQPTKHTGDHLMACWIGREMARRNGFDDPEFRSTTRSAWVEQSRHSGF